MTNSPEFIRKSEQKSSPIFSGGLALGMIVGISFGIFLMIGLEGIFGQNPLAQPTVIIGLIATLAALTSCFLALLALSEQRKSRQAGTDPVLIDHFSQREDARDMIMLSISNMGAGAALNVKLEVIADFDPKDHEILTNVFERHEPFRTILQNNSISFNFGVGFRLLGDNPVPPFTVSLEYMDIDQTSYSGSFSLDIREMEKLGSEKSLHQRHAEATETIGKAVKAIADGTKKPLVIMQTKKQYQNEMDELREAFRKQRME